MKLTFFGAAQEVTGSKYLLTLSTGTLLVECGLVQGRREESREQNRSLPRAVLDADACILTHAHIDHSGNLPTLVKSGFKGSIYATPATRDLCAHMLRDAARIQVSDAEYLNRKFEDDPHHKEIEPLYDEDDAIAALEAFVTVPYHKHFNPLPGVTATFLNAGHILGSSELVLDIDDNGVKRRIVFSGDLGRKGLPIIRDPERPPTPVDYLVMESTYGNRVHASVDEIHGDLERVINETVKRGGKVIVPAFAVGRTQELIYALNELSRAGRIPKIPVFIDSPLAINITEVFKLHPECFDAEARAFIEEHGDLFGFEGVQYMATKQDSISLNTMKGPAVIISASGMCEAGRVLHHLRNNIEDEKNTILIVGFMAQHTLGRRIVERRPRVKIWGVERDLRAKVEVLQSMSAHADRNDLLAFADACGPKTKRVFLVHGETEGQTALKDTLVERGFQVSVPARGETVDLA